MSERHDEQAGAAKYGAFNPRVFVDLLERLTGSRAVAYLLVSDGQSEKCAFFPAGGLRLSSIGPRRGRTAVDAVLAHPKVTPEQRRRVEAARARVAEARARGEDVDDHDDDPSRSDDGGKAQRHNALEAALGGPDLRPVYHECCRAVVRDELIDMLLWDGAEYELRESNPPPKLFSSELEATKLSLGVKDVLEEVQRLGLDWQKLAKRLGQPSRTLLQPTAAPPRPMPPVETALAAAVRGRPAGECTLEDAVLGARRAGIDALAACHAALALERQGVLTIDVKPPPPTPAQRRARTQSDLEKIEAAIRLMIQQLVARKRMAQCCEELGDKQKAVENWRLVGEELVAARRQADAVDAYRHVVRLAPEAYFARERIAGLYEQLGRLPEAVKEWLDLSRLFAGLRLFNRAQGGLRRAIQLDPQDLDHRRRLIDVLEAQGKVEEAASEWEELARRYEAAGRDGEALACYQRLATLPGEHAEARARLARAARRGASYVAPFVAVGLGAVALLGLGAWVTARYQAIEAFRAARAQALAHAHESRYREAHAALDDAQAEHGLDPLEVDPVRAVVDGLLADEAQGQLDLAQARDLQGDVPTARDVYRRVERDFAGTPFAAGAAERLRAYLAREEQAAREAEAVAGLARGGQVAEALSRGRALARTAGWTEAARTLELPLEVRSTPAGAGLSIDGQPAAARTPHVLHHAPAPPVALRLGLDGYQPHALTVDLMSPAVTTPLQVELQRAPRWRHEGPGPLLDAPWVGSEGLVVAGAERTVYGLGWDGHERWRLPLALFAGAAGTPVAMGELVVVVEVGAPGRGRVVAFEPRRGQARWSLEVQGDDPRLVGALAGGVVVSTRDRLLLLDDGGQQTWSLELAEPLVAPAQLAGERVFAPTGDGLVLVVGRGGEVEGRLRVEGRPCAAPVATSAGCLVGTEAGDLAVVWRDVVWSRRLPAPLSAAPLVADGVVYAPAGQTLVALDLRDGSPRWERRLEAPLTTPAHRSGRVYVGGADGALHALVAQSGEPRWVFRAGGPLRAAPVVHRGMVYVASSDGALHAIPD